MPSLPTPAIGVRPAAGPTAAAPRARRPWDPRQGRDPAAPPTRDNGGGFRAGGMLDPEPLAPCPVHGGEERAGCGWCRLAKDAPVRDVVRGWVALYLRPREPGGRVEAVAIVLVVGVALLVEADVA